MPSPPAKRARPSTMDRQILPRNIILAAQTFPSLLPEFRADTESLTESPSSEIPNSIAVSEIHSGQRAFERDEGELETGEAGRREGERREHPVPHFSFRHLPRKDTAPSGRMGASSCNLGFLANPCTD